MSELRFYLDENVNPMVSEQLRQHGIDAVTARDLGVLGDADISRHDGSNQGNDQLSKGELKDSAACSQLMNDIRDLSVARW